MRAKPSGAEILWLKIVVQLSVGNNAVAEEGLTICGVGVRLACVGGGVEPSILSEVLLCEGFEGGGVYEDEVVSNGRLK